MNHLFVPYDIAVMAKNSGFKEKSLGVWDAPDFIGKLLIGYKTPSDLVDKEFLAPLYQQLVDWFRRRHKLHIEITFDFIDDKEFDCVVIGIDGTFYGDTLFQDKDYYTALNKTIQEAFKLIKN